MSRPFVENTHFMALLKLLRSVNVGGKPYPMFLTSSGDCPLLPPARLDRLLGSLSPSDGGLRPNPGSCQRDGSSRSLCRCRSRSSSFSSSASSTSLLLSS